MTRVNIVGAGLAGLSAAIHLAMNGIPSRLISAQPSERAQSVLAEGGINGALNTMGEDDCTQNHFQDTMKAGCDIADAKAVHDLTEHAPDVLRWLDGLGVPFQRKGNTIQQRNFGGQKKKRTAYAESSTGKVLMTALIDEARKYEATGLITRYSRHDFVRLLVEDENRTTYPALAGFSAYRKDKDDHKDTDTAMQHIPEQVEMHRLCKGVLVRDHISGEAFTFTGPVLMATGGLNGFFPGRTTGTTANTGDAAAVIFAQGVTFSNLEMIQYHPTTLSIPGKRLLVSEAARGEGGRLYIERNGSKWYFMEEKYPELGNLMPRDVVSREEYFVMHDPDCGDQVYLDCTGLSSQIWKTKLPDLRREVLYYTELDPAKKPIPIEPGIHYFMGGIDTDAAHHTNIGGLYAAGECCSLYHGANRLGGNSTLGAIYGGQRAAETIAEELAQYEAYVAACQDNVNREEEVAHPHEHDGACPEISVDTKEAGRAAGQMSHMPGTDPVLNRDAWDEQLGKILFDALGVVRNADELETGERLVSTLLVKEHDEVKRARCILGLAILRSARFRKESRGAQYRSDFPQRDDDYLGTVTAQYHTGQHNQAEDLPEIDIQLRLVNDQKNG